jgi:hypothetical protein
MADIFCRAHMQPVNLITKGAITRNWLKHSIVNEMSDLENILVLSAELTSHWLTWSQTASHMACVHAYDRD